MSSPLVTVIILSYNRPHYFEHALQSVVKQTYHPIQAIVIDNPSPASDRIRAIVDQYPQVEFVQPRENRGFAGGMNEGIRRAKGEYIYLTEDDVVLEPDCVESFVKHFDTEQRPALAAGLMMNHGSRTILCAGGMVELQGIMRLKVLGQNERDVSKYSSPYEVNFIPGSMVFARTAVLQRLGGFREDFFMYFEDTELCFRALKHGVKVIVVPSAKAYHFEPKNEPVRDYVEWHKQKNIFKLYLLHASMSVLPVFFLRYAVVDLVKAAVRNQSRFRLLVRALAAVFPKVPGLMRQRSMLAPTNT